MPEPEKRKCPLARGMGSELCNNEWKHGKTLQNRGLALLERFVESQDAKGKD